MTFQRGLLRLSRLCFALAVVVLVVMALLGCSNPARPDTVEARTSNEAYILEATHEMATRAGTWANPRITDAVYLTTCSDGTQCPAAGWVPNGGKSHDIYYWAPWVNDATQKQMRVLVAHEVAHVACGCDLGEGE